MKNTKFRNHQIITRLPSLSYNNGLHLSPLNFPASFPSRFYSTNLNSSFISSYKIGSWTFYIFNFNYDNIGHMTENISLVFKDFHPDKNYALFFQGIYQNIHYISIGPKVLVNKDTGAEFLKQYFEHYLELLSLNQYNIEDISRVIIKVRSTDILQIKQPVIPDSYKGIAPSFPKTYLNEKYYPASVDQKDFGNLVEVSINNKNQEVFTYEYNNYTIIRTKISEDQFSNEVYSGSLKICEFRDTIIKEGPDYSSPYFIREINNKLKIYYAIGEKLIFKRELIQNAKKINQIKLSFNEKQGFFTFDIETYLKDNKHHPYACGWYDGETLHSHYLTNYPNAEEMLATAIKEIIEKVNSGKDFKTTQVVYVHNLSHFDGVYLLKVLNRLGKLKIVEKDGRIIYINFSMVVSYLNNKGILKERKIKLKFFDSVQLIPAPLRSLSNEFETQTQKGYFPYRFVTENNLEYKGAVPPLDYFEGISVQEYNSLLDKEWDLKEQTLKYLEKDLQSLYEVIKNFAHNVFDEFNLNIFDFPTTSSLALAIYRGHFLKKDDFIPILSGNTPEVFSRILLWGYY